MLNQKEIIFTTLTVLSFFCSAAVADLTVENQTFTTGNYTFQTSDTLIAKNLVTEASATLTLRTNQELKVDSAFEIKDGATWVAEIGPPTSLQGPSNPTISIDEGDFTNQLTLNLTLSALDATEMIIDTDSNFTNSSYVPYATTATINISNQDQLHTVYIKYKGQGIETGVVQASITLDTQIPVIQALVPVDGMTVTGR